MRERIQVGGLSPPDPSKLRLGWPTNSVLHASIEGQEPCRRGDRMQDAQNVQELLW
jgi:hypothetical protein